jgi:O-antigen/teichoic acid export membrane protein
MLGEAGVYVAANVANAALPFLLIPFLTRALGPGPYGLVAMFGVTVNVLAAFVGMNANSAVSVRYFQLTAPHLRAYLGACLVILAVSAGLVAIAAWSMDAALARLTQLPLRWILVAVVIASSNFVTSIRLTLWQVARRPWPYALLSVGQNALYLAVALALVLGGQRGWEGVAAAQAVGALAAGLASLVMLRRDFAIRLAGERPDIRDALAYGVPLVPHLVGGLLIAGGDRYLVGHLLGLGSAGVYMVALQIGMALGVLTGAFNRAYMPWLLARLAVEDAARDIRIVRGTYVYGVLLASLAAIVTVLAPNLIAFVAGPTFSEAVPVVGWIAAAYVFGGLYYMVTNYVFFAGRTGTLSWITLASGTCGLLASTLFIPRYGLQGAGMGYLVSNLLMFLGTWWLAHRVRPMPWWQAVATLGPSTVRQA